jgi:hypothetical protein
LINAPFFSSGSLARFDRKRLIDFGEKQARELVVSRPAGEFGQGWGYLESRKMLGGTIHRKEKMARETMPPF